MRGPLWHLIPSTIAPKNDLGIIKKLVNIVSPHNGSAPYGYASPYNRVLEFKPSSDNAENHNDSFIKLKFTVAGLSADAKFALLDGAAVSFFSAGVLKQQNGTELENLQQLNRYRLSDLIQTCFPRKLQVSF